MTEAMTQVESSMAAKPAHVPDHLVFDFDIFHDERIKDDVQLGYMSLHRDAPDIFWTPRNGGHWMATRFDDVTAIATNPVIFSSVGQSHAREEGELPLPPQNMDAPDHMRHRLLLLKFLSPRNLKEQQPFVRRLAIELIDSLKGRSACDFRKEIAVVLPVTVFMTVMKWDTSNLHEMTSWVHDVVNGDDPAIRGSAFIKMSQFLRTVIEERIAHPDDDPISILLGSEVNGEPLTPQRVQEMANLLFTAGLDTVTNAMTYAMQYLATDLAMQQRLRARPQDIPAAVEEFLRRFSFVATTRRVTKDTELSGVKLRAEDRITCSLAAASNDERVIPHPQEVDLDRSKCPHVAFNTGPHACVGAPLARAELGILLEEWLARMPDVSLAPGFKAVVRGGPVATIEALDIVW